MGLFVSQDDKRSELQEKIAADLREKAKRSSAETPTDVDGIEDAAYIEGTKTTTSLAWAWVIIFLMACGLVTIILTR